MIFGTKIAIQAPWDSASLNKMLNLFLQSNLVCRLRVIMDIPKRSMKT